MSQNFGRGRGRGGPNFPTARPVGGYPPDAFEPIPPRQNQFNRSVGGQQSMQYRPLGGQQQQQQFNRPLGGGTNRSSYEQNRGRNQSRQDEGAQRSGGVQRGSYINNNISRSGDGYNNNQRHGGLQNETDRANMMEGADRVQKMAAQAQEMARGVANRRLETSEMDEDEDVSID